MVVDSNTGVFSSHYNRTSTVMSNSKETRCIRILELSEVYKFIVDPTMARI